MIVDLPKYLEAAIKEQALANGVSPEGYVSEILERQLSQSGKSAETVHSLTTGYGMLARYGAAPSAEEIDANRSEIFQGFGEHA